MKQNKRKSTALAGAVAGVAALAMLVSGGSAASAAETRYPSDAAQPDLVKLLADYENYYKPANTYDKNDPSKPFGKGEVKDAATLRNDDDMTLAINQAAAKADATGDGTTTATAQQRRALIDADYKMAETLPDSLGPVLGQYFSEGLENGSLPRVKSLIVEDHKDPKSGYSVALMSDYLDTTTAKVTFNHTRPLYDRTDGGYVAAGLEKTVPITHVPDYTVGSTTHKAGYDGFATSGSFPSGHTTYAYSGGIALATLFPQLAPEIVTRASEAGNNRIVLGVHYPLDIMGGRIDGEVSNATRWSDEQFRNEQILPAFDELQSYIAGKCVADGHATKQATDVDTVQECVNNLGANDANGYKNAFVDPVSKVAVTDRQSAIQVFTNRLTYNFKQTGQAGQDPVVPDAAANLLITAFPTLNADQRKQVLAATEIDSGYPLDASSEGYQRLNLAAAYSAKVTVDAKGAVTKVEPGQKQASVVYEAGQPEPVYRLYNPNVASGSHLYTASADEYTSLQSKGWTAEGVAFYGTADANAGTPVYRLYNPVAGWHHYTSDVNEYNGLKSSGWNDEGVAWYVPSYAAADVYRAYDPVSGDHLFTTNKDEIATVTAHGWRDEGVAYKAVSNR